MNIVSKSGLAAERQRHREGFEGVYGNRPEEVDAPELVRQRTEHRKILDKLSSEIAAIEQSRAIVADQVKSGSAFPVELVSFDLRLAEIRGRMLPHEECVKDLDERLAAIDAATPT